MRNKTLSVICVAFASSSVAASLLLNAYAGIALLLPAVIIFLVLRRGSGGDGNRLDSDSIRFVERLIDNYSDSMSTPRLIELSLSPDLWFCKDIEGSLSRYALHGNAELAFSGPLDSSNNALREIAAALVQRLDSGADILNSLKGIRRRLRSDSRYRLKLLGGALSSDSVARLGSAFFFPAFAGISLQIMDFASASQGFAAANASVVAAIFAFYIISTNITNFRYALGAALSMERPALACAIGMLVFRLSSMLSIAAL
jgi:hypothetical protein